MDPKVWDDSVPVSLEAYREMVAQRDRFRDEVTRLKAYEASMVRVAGGVPSRHVLHAGRRDAARVPDRMRLRRVHDSGLSGVNRILDALAEWARTLRGCCLVLGWWLVLYLLSQGRR